MNTVPTDSPSVFAALNTLVLNSSQLAIVRPNDPPPGIAGFVFDVEDDNGSELESDITDYFIEDNSAIQDHIALRPEIVTVTGEVAEVVMAQPVLTPTTPQSNPLPLVSGFRPALSPGAEAQRVLAQQTSASQAASVEVTKSLYGYYNSRLPQQPNQTKQSKAYGFLYQLWKGRQLFSVETPWGFFTNMAIQSLAAHQGPQSRFVTDFTVTFKKIRTVRSVTITPGNLAGRATFQQAPITQNGTVGQVPATPAQVQQFQQQTTLSPVNPFL